MIVDLDSCFHVYIMQVHACLLHFRAEKKWGDGRGGFFLNSCIYI